MVNTNLSLQFIYYINISKHYIEEQPQLAMLLANMKGQICEMDLRDASDLLKQ